MNIKPIGKRVVIELEKEVSQTASGIYIPESASQEKKSEGIISAIGDNLESSLKVGDKVLYSKFSGTEYENDDVKIVIVEEKEILAIIG